MPNYRVIPPGSVTGSITTVVNGRQYTCAAGAALDVPDFDGKLLEANGWNKIGDIGSGTTAQRAAYTLSANSGGGTGPVHAGDEWFDTTLGYVVAYDGNNWHNPSTGVAV